MSDKRGFSREEAAEYLGISFYKVCGAIRDAKLPAKRHGKDVIVLREDLDDYLDQMPSA